LDIETTGLSGGAGTVAFLVGLGWFEDGAFLSTQYLLTRLTGERQLLTHIGEQLKGTGTIVTFNGKSFDLPIIETRWLYHRLMPPLPSVAHLDLLHPARRLWWGERSTLFDLERIVLRFCRRGDPPSAEIPARYVAYLRTGRFSLLGPVLEHNRLDVLSLALLTARAVHVVARGAQDTSDPFQCLGLGRLYERAGRHEDACECYRHVAGLAVNGPGGAEALAEARQASRTGQRPEVRSQKTEGRRQERDPERLRVPSLFRLPPSDFCSSCPSWWGDWTAVGAEGDRLRAEALYRLALSARRTGEYTAAAEYWKHILHLGAPPARYAVEAATALAIHHEHRLKDFAGARAHARRALAVGPVPHQRRAVEQRLRRLDRKTVQRECQAGLIEDDQALGATGKSLRP